MATSTGGDASTDIPSSDNSSSNNDTGQQVTQENQQPQEGAAPQRPGGWQMLKTFAFQLLIFYFITSWFKGGSKETPTSPDGTPLGAAVNVFNYGQAMDLYIYLTSEEGEELALDSAQLIWHVSSLEYGNWYDGSLKDGGRYEDITIPVPQIVQENGSWYAHVLLVRSGSPLSSDDPQYDSNAIVHEIKQLNRYRKQRLHNTANLITGKADIAPGAIKASDQADGEEVKIVSYWHPNITVNLVYDNTRFIKGQIPPPLDKYILFNDSDTGYYPILYINDYWNLAAEYTPMNDTVKEVTLHLAFTPLSFFRFQLYASVTRDNPWAQWVGQPDQSDEDQDTLKETLLETNPYLLTLTVIVSIIHTVFEFLAFKNDVQFWRSRKSLEGLSVRSVFFGVFQSFIVLLYILDNETNFVVIISVFIGLLIDMWKITKVMEVKLDRQNLIGGLIPRLTITDRPSYVDSSTREYDKLAFKYLGWLLFPLFLCYGVYSLVYQEHKGWYSFILSMLYGFLLTFGFITMTPQLFINYKLKSVAHLPWRMLTYKALNTFIDDMFAFVIKMPTMYRIGCFRDDIVFFIYLYQRWAYRVDPKRVNEFGTSGDDETGGNQAVQGVNGIGEKRHEEESEVVSELEGEIKSLTDKKED